MIDKPLSYDSFWSERKNLSTPSSIDFIRERGFQNIPLEVTPNFQKITEFINGEGVLGGLRTYIDFQYPDLLPNDIDQLKSDLPNKYIFTGTAYHIPDVANVVTLNIPLIYIRSLITSPKSIEQFIDNFRGNVAKGLAHEIDHIRQDKSQFQKNSTKETVRVVQTLGALIDITRRKVVPWAGFAEPIFMIGEMFGASLVGEQIYRANEAEVASRDAEKANGHILKKYVNVFVPNKEKLEADYFWR